MAYRDGLSFKTHYKDKVFLISIEPTGELYKYNRPKTRPKKGNVPLTNLKPCKDCKYLLIGDVCINRGCPSNSHLPYKTGRLNRKPRSHNIK